MSFQPPSGKRPPCRKPGCAVIVLACLGLLAGLATLATHYL